MDSIFLPGCKAEVAAIYKTKEIIRNWKEAYNINVDRFFGKDSEITEYRCPVSGIYFFRPSTMTDDSKFYEELMQYPWYYVENKWEFNKALNLIEPHSKVLEIGAGSGNFIRRCLEVGLNVKGLELNEAMVQRASIEGLPIYLNDLYEMDEADSGAWDVVISFQVMEHIPDPVTFLRASLNLLKQGGKLIMAVPNNDLKWMRQFNLLNLPPHHMLGWTLGAFNYLENILPIRKLAVYREPLDKLHIYWYLDCIQQQNFWIRQFLRWKPFKRIGSWILHKGGRYFISGHSYLCVFQKIKT